MPRRISSVEVTPHFSSAFRKLSADLKAKAIVAESRFRANAFDPRLRTHRLKGALKHLWSFRIDLPNRITFEFLTDETVLLHDIGSHAIYR